MKTQRLLLGLSGLALILAIGMVLSQRRQLQQAREQNQLWRSEAAQIPEIQQQLAQAKRAGQAEVDELLERASRKERELPKLRGDAAQTRMAQAELAQLERARVQAGQAAREKSARISEAMRGPAQRNAALRFQRLQEKVPLSPAQAEAIEEILQRRADMVAAAAAAVLSGNVPQESAAMPGQKLADVDTEIRALLSPEQQLAYDAFDLEQRVEQARAAAGSELRAMQQMVGLEEGQTEAVLKVLQDQALEEQRAEVSGRYQADPAGFLASMLQRKVEALGRVLTPDQVAVYRQQQETQLAQALEHARAIVPMVKRSGPE
jgi:hypothetical protein